MINHDFLVLSPNEFENLTRDLLQKKFEIYIESFTSGPDGGIDLRYSTESKTNNIIQAKRYKTYSSLISNLKKEINKVNELNPDKYIISTSVGLTPKNKKEIQNLFNPYILKQSDILGKDDLNNLLSQFPDLEKKYYKLWLSSTNILNKVLHSKVYNQSAFELEEIKEQIKLYVQNDSFDMALKILNGNKYLIVSGIPGIGKTTLARVVVLYLLSNNFEEFIFLNQSIDDGYELFKVEKSQIFLFDDFLGKNFLENNLLPNEDAKIIKFIEKIKKSPNKRIIFTTREYILNQATGSGSFESFKIKNIELAKCILDISSYTNLIKAQILYNHLFFADVPREHINDLLKTKTYLEVIKHDNYNPRIIETLVNRKIWEDCEPKDFSKTLIGLFNNPESVWLSAFENSISLFSQYSLLLLLTLDTLVLLDDWEKAIQEFCKINGNKYSIQYSSISFHKTIKELENTFIVTQKDSYKNIVVKYQNPSIQDFLVNYLEDKNDIIENLLNSSIFYNQIFRIFTTDDNHSKNKIWINKRIQYTIKNRLISAFDLFTSSSLYRLSINDQKFRWTKNVNLKYTFLKNIHREYSSKDNELNDLLINEFQKEIYFTTIEYTEQNSYIYLLNNIDLEKLDFDEKKLVREFIKAIEWLDRFELLLDLEPLFPEAYKEITKSNIIQDRVKDILDHELQNLKDADVFDLQQNLDEIEKNYHLNLREESYLLDEKATELEESIDNQVETHIEEGREFKDEPEPNENIDDQIDQIFNSLR